MLRSVCAAFVLSAAVGPGVADAAAVGPFLAHQAVYDLSLKKTRSNAGGVNAVRGRILYRFAGSTCEGYTTEFRQVSELQSGESKTTLSDLRSTSWEDAAGKSYRFNIESRMNDADATEVDGIAERSDDGITVKLKQPVAKTFTLGKEVVFPTEQVKRIIEAAKEGKTILELVVYDGSDGGEKVYNTLTVIGQPIPGDHPPAAPDASTANSQLKSLTPAPIRRNAVPTISRTRSSRTVVKIRVASCVGVDSDCARVRWRKSAVLSFSVIVEPHRLLFLRRSETFSHSRHSTRSMVMKSRMSFSNVVSLEIVLASRSGTTLRSSMPRASRHSRRPSLPSCFIRSVSSARCRSLISRKPRCASFS
jgi:hypothetical protein